MNGELPELYEELFPKARKNHTCCECKREIIKGESYQLVKGLWNGEWEKYKTCLPCMRLRNDLRDTDYGVPAFTYLQDAAYDADVKFPPDKE